MLCVWELTALVRRYDRCMDDGDASHPDDLALAVECYMFAAGIKERIYEEADRFGVPLPGNGRWPDDLGAIRAFIAGGGWQ